MLRPNGRMVSQQDATCEDGRVLSSHPIACNGAQSLHATCSLLVSIVRRAFTRIEVTYFCSRHRTYFTSERSMLLPRDAESGLKQKGISRFGLNSDTGQAHCRTVFRGGAPKNIGDGTLCVIFVAI